MRNKGNKVVIIMGVIIIILVVVCILLGINKISFTDEEVKQNNSNISNDTKNNETITNSLSVVFSKECEDGCEKKINSTSGEKTLYVSPSEIKLGDKDIYKANEGPISLQQVSVYRDIIVSLETEALNSKMYIYDLDGNEVKVISRFVDKEGNQYQIYPSYSQDEVFNISNDGVIRFAGTKHIQGSSASSYITNSGDIIDLCETKDEYQDDGIVSAIFEMNYLNDYHFSDISYVSTKTTVKDIRNCSN